MTYLKKAGSPTLKTMTHTQYMTYTLIHVGKSLTEQMISY